MQKTKSIKKEFIRFAVPSVIAQWVFALYTMVDGIFVARGVGELALAAVNISMPFVNFLFAISLVMAIGSSTLISIKFGEEDSHRANEIYSQNLITVGILSVILMALVFLNLNSIARFLGATPDTMEYVTTYIGTIAAFAPCFMFSYYFEILIKADGRPKLATVMVITGAVMNCILDYLFVFVFPWGIFGAAFATGLSQLTVAVFFAIYFFSGNSRLKVVKPNATAKLFARTVRLGLPSGITDFSAGIMIFFFNHAILTHIGEEGIISYTIVAYISTLVVMSLTGIAQGMQPLASYSHGSGDEKTCNKLLRYGVIAGALFTVAILVPTWLGAKGIVSIFIAPEHTALRAYSVKVFRIFSLSFIPICLSVVIGGWLTAVEKEKPAIAISLSRGFILIVASLWVLTYFFGGDGIWWAPLLSESVSALLAVWLLSLSRKRDSQLKAQPRAVQKSGIEI